MVSNKLSPKVSILGLKIEYIVLDFLLRQQLSWTKKCPCRPKIESKGVTFCSLKLCTIYSFFIHRTQAQRSCLLPIEIKSKGLAFLNKNQVQWTRYLFMEIKPSRVVFCLSHLPKNAQTPSQHSTQTR